MDSKFFLKELRSQISRKEHFRQDTHKLTEGAINQWSYKEREGYTVKHADRFFAIKWLLEELNGEERVSVLVLPLSEKDQIAGPNQTATLRNRNEEDGNFFINSVSNKPERRKLLEDKYSGTSGFPRFEKRRTWLGPITEPEFLGNLLDVAATTAITENTKQPPASFWAGGFLWNGTSMVEEFIANNRWQMGWKADNSNSTAQQCWEFFRQIKKGDWFAIKGYGGRNDLNIHYIGRVIKIDSAKGELKLERHNTVQLFRGKAPSVAGTGGNWRKALTPVISPTAIEAIFGIKSEDFMPLPLTSATFDMHALNTILYGPPGTGKTFSLRTRYMEQFTERQVILTPEEQAASLVKNLSWWEVIALALLDTTDHCAPVSKILEHPLVEARHNRAANRNPRAMIWAALQTHTVVDCPSVKYSKRMDPLLFWKDENSIWSLDVKKADVERPELREILNRFHNPENKAVPLTCRYRFTTFHQSFSYEDFIEGIKPQMEEREDGQIAYEIRDGVFKEICNEAATNPDKPYALFIDEINRGNVASIFGELITLIEDDKRLGAENELKAVLPYSREEFGVPSNLYIIGTMNTADRSVEALDTALRRRFTFEEMRPDPDLIVNPIDLGVDLQSLFKVINARIEQLLDHDHCIGHAYFMNIKTLADLRRVFANKIVPLLREYFYGNPAKIGMVLGDQFLSRITDRVPFASGSWGLDDFDEKMVYKFADISELSPEAFASIYA